MPKGIVVERAMRLRVPERDLKRLLVYEVGMTGTNRRCGNDSGGARLFRVCRLVTKGMNLSFRGGLERRRRRYSRSKMGNSAGFAAGGEGMGKNE